jgi:hypothetical protein
MNASEGRVHYYHADASPIGGYLTQPFESILQSDASVSLGQAGGHSASRMEQFKLDELIRSGASYSQVTGSVQKGTGNWTTLVTSSVENLNVMEVVTADRIVSRMSIEHPRVGYYPKISFAGTQFENLRVNGKVIQPVVDLDLLTAVGADAKGAPAKEGEKPQAEAAPSIIEFPDVPWPDVQSFTRKAVDQSARITTAKGAPAWLKSRFEWIASPEARQKRGYVLCSLVNEVNGAAPGTNFGHVLVVPDFGNIFLGELIVDMNSFHLTMVRAELGCAAQGNVSFASTRGNGIPMP